MNIALPALVVFLILLPGFILRSRFKRAERTSIDYSPFGQVVAEAVLCAAVLHMVWLMASYWVFGKYLDAAVLLKLLSSDATSQGKATDAVAAQFRWVSAYFVTILVGSHSLPKAARSVITKYRLDRIGAPLSSLLRIHAPWYYLLTGADFEKGQVPDLISVSAIVDVAGDAVLYVGILEEFFVDSEGNLDRLVLQEVMRRPISADKDPVKPEAWSDKASRFYEVDGDYFVLRYSEAITLNVQYIKLEKSYPTPTEVEPSTSATSTDRSSSTDDRVDCPA